MKYHQKILSVSEDTSEILSHWDTLTHSCPHHFFQSVSWVKTWLMSFQNTNDIDQLDVRGFFLFEEGDVDCRAPVVGFLFGQCDAKKIKLLPSRQFVFYGAGITTIDKLTPEYNDILVKPGFEFSLDTLFESEALGKFDQYRMHGISDENFERIEKGFARYLLKGRSVKSYGVDLKTLRAEDKPYINVLSKNKRQQVRRAIKAYEATGEIKLDVANSVEQAKSMLVELAELHEKTWAQRGEMGAFSSDYFTQFHNQLIEESFEKGEILVCQLATPEKVIGYIYGFVYNNEFLFYQNGFTYESDNKFKPGFVSHYYLINYFMERGLDIYDFLEGDAGYKQSLSNHARNMYELTLFKPTLINRLYLFAHGRAKAWLESRRSS